MKIMLTTVILVALISALASGDNLRGAEGGNDACRAVTTTAHLLNGAHKSFIFRCRPGDDCGGVGDRFGGVIGGAFYAFQHGRTFRILWPGLEHVFTPRALNWTFDPTALQIPYQDANGVEIDKTRVVNNLGNQIYADVVGNEVGVVNDLNTRQIINQTAVAIIEKYKHVYFHSNRGPNEEMYLAVAKKNNWPMKGATEKSYSADYFCTFEAMFSPAESFLKTQYKSLGREPMLFSHLLKIVENPETMSMSYHHRVDDVVAASNSSENTISDKTIARIIAISETHNKKGSKKANLFFITNSVASMHKVMASPALKAAFNQVYCQELSAQIHVNDADRGQQHSSHASHPAVLSTQQAFRDWWIMRQSDVLVGGLSGFLKSAALFAAATQVRYEDEGNAPRPNYWVMCGGRFC